MQASHERVLYYHADASPLGGSLTHPYESALDAQASVSLNQSGGHASARIEKFKLDDLIRSGAAYSQVAGSIEKSTRNWTTLVTSVVEDLNLLEVVTADRIVSRLAIEHPREGYYPKVAFVGCQYENLRINGKPVTPELDLNLLTLDKPETQPRKEAEGGKLSTKPAPPDLEFPDTPWPEVKSFVDKAVEQARRITDAKGAPDWLKRRYEWMNSAEVRSKKGYILCSVVNEVSGTPRASTFGHVISVPDFGNIFLGELIVDPKSFQLTMLRVEMGCLAKGHVSFAAARANGFPMP
ncbi:MAG: hypothetical protein ABI197_11200 [Granulicella sp.]